MTYFDYGRCLDGPVACHSIKQEWTKPKDGYHETDLFLLISVDWRAVAVLIVHAAISEVVAGVTVERFPDDLMAQRRMPAAAAVAVVPVAISSWPSE